MVSDDGDRFDDRERFRFQFLANSLFWRYQDFFDQYRHGTVDDDLWIRRRNFAHVLVHVPEWRRWWQAASDGNLFPPSFVDEINSAPEGQSTLIEELTGNQKTQP